MSASTCHPDRLNHVILAARQQLRALLQQRTEIENRVRVARRTVKGLAVVFGRSVQESAIGEGAEPAQRGFDSANAVIASNRATKKRTKEVRSQQEDRNSSLRFERACRIALLESDEPSTAGQVYDRILRRRSYGLESYKRPLKAIMSTLDRLVQKNEVECCVHHEVRSWVWIVKPFELWTETDSIALSSPAEKRQAP
jgi:hypothetical protein